MQLKHWHHILRFWFISDSGISEEKTTGGYFSEEISNDSNNTLDADTLEKVEELIQKKRLPQDQTITIHSPESGTTIF